MAIHCSPAAHCFQVSVCDREVESHKFVELSLVQIQDDQLFAYPYHVHFGISYSTATIILLMTQHYCEFA